MVWLQQLPAKKPLPPSNHASALCWLTFQTIKANKLNSKDSLTLLASARTLQYPDIVRLAAPRLDAEVGKLDGDAGAPLRQADPPFTEGVIGVGARVLPGGEDTAVWALNGVTTAVIWGENTKQEGKTQIRLN